MLPSLSIVTPSFNQAPFLRDTIESVLSQNYPQLQYWVMDGGSTDGSVELLRGYGDRLQWVSEPDGGQANAINRGFARCSGDIFAWINSDDRYAPGAFERVGQLFADHPEVDWVFGRCPIIDRNGSVIKKWITRYKEFWMQRYSYRRLLIESFINQPAVFFRRSLFARVGPLDPNYHCALDYHLFVRMAAVSTPHFVDAELAHFRIWGDGKTSRQFEVSFAEELDAARRVAAGQYPWLMFRHELNRRKLVAVYRLLAWIQSLRAPEPQ